MFGFRSAALPIRLFSECSDQCAWRAGVTSQGGSRLGAASGSGLFETIAMTRKSEQMEIETAETNNKEPASLREGIDFYFENGLMVLTAHFLRRRGYCCNNGCRHCPYPDRKKRAQSK